MIVGGIYIVRTTLTKPSKNKIILCICAADGLFFWINSEARLHGVGQIPLRVADHPQVLTHDSYLDCSRVTTFSAGELAGAAQRGMISRALALRISDHLIASPPRTLSARYLNMAAANLSMIGMPEA